MEKPIKRRNKSNVFTFCWSQLEPLKWHVLLNYPIKNMYGSEKKVMVFWRRERMSSPKGLKTWKAQPASSESKINAGTKLHLITLNIIEIAIYIYIYIQLQHTEMIICLENMTAGSKHSKQRCRLGLLIQTRLD